MPLFPGDPLTPGVGATKEAKRLAIKDAPTLTKIPVLPISYADALPLLRNLEGAVVPESWRGALPITRAEEEATSDFTRTEDFRNACQAFLAKQKPVFHGR